MTEDEEKQQKEARRKREEILALFLLLLTQTDASLKQTVLGYLTGTVAASVLLTTLHDTLLGAHTTAYGLGRQLAGAGADTDADAAGALAVMAGQLPYLHRLVTALRHGEFDVEDGELPGALRQRLGLYVLVLRGTANEAWTKSFDPDTLLDWVLGGCRHCDVCPQRAAGGPYRAADRQWDPGDGSTSCLSRCCCRWRIHGTQTYAFPMPNATFGDFEPMNDESVTVEFALPGSGRYEADGYAVYPNSLLFRAGDYPDKQFNVTSDDLATMAREWQPIAGNIEHKRFMRGRAGVIEQATADGDELRGVVKIPLLLDNVLTDAERKVSLEFHRLTKRATEFALTASPHITDAVLMSSVEPSHHRAQRAILPKGSTMKELLARLLQRLTGSEPLDAQEVAQFTEALETVADPPAPVFSEDDAKQLRDEIAALKVIRAEHMAEAARMWTAQQVRDGRALVVEAPTLTALFSTLAADDAASPATVTFSEGKTGGRLDMLRSLVESRTPHLFFSESVPDEQVVALFNKMETARQGEEKPMDDKRRQELLGKSGTLGRAILNDRRG